MRIDKDWIKIFLFFSFVLVCLVGSAFFVKAQWEIAQSYGMSFIEFLLWNGKIVITK